MQNYFVVLFLLHLCERLLLFREGIGGASLQKLIVFKVYLYSFEFFVHVVSDEFLKALIFLFYSLIFVSDGVFFLLLKLGKAFFKLLFVPEFAFNKFGV